MTHDQVCTGRGENAIVDIGWQVERDGYVVVAGSRKATLQGPQAPLPFAERMAGLLQPPHPALQRFQ
jgi:hypothetical protein